jgi:hypothetical protein
LRDPRWLAEEWTDDRGTWGKMAAKRRGLTMRKESPNGRAHRRLTAIERWVVLTSALGKEVVKDEALPGVTLFIGERERGGGPGPTHQRQDIGGVPDRLDHGVGSAPRS